MVNRPLLSMEGDGVWTGDPGSSWPGDVEGLPGLSLALKISDFLCNKEEQKAWRIPPREYEGRTLQIPKREFDRL